MSTPRKMPIGIQSFEDIRTNGYVYVDKTQYVYRLVSEGKPYFLSRPRRFGKSLFLSTLEAYFLGKKELFSGLALETLEQENTKEPWTVYPVLHLDLNSKKYDEPSSLNKMLSAQLDEWEKKYNLPQSDNDPELRFTAVIRAAHEATGRQVAVLVDEYDKPLIEVLDNEALYEDYRKTLKAFYGVLKSEDAHLKFVFLTGVTKFSQVSVFSDLNQLRDISMDRSCSGICGISGTELDAQFKPEIAALAEETGATPEECRAKLRALYDGYHFHPEGEDMYNPFSLLNTFASLEYSYYWFQTGTPSFLVKMMDRSGFDLRTMASGVEAGKNAFTEYRFDMNTPVPLLYQSGYLTIKDYNKEFGIYTLAFPNEEVRYGFMNYLLPHETSIPAPETAFYIGKFVTDLREGDVDSFMTRLKSILASVPYPVNGKPVAVNEQTFQTGCFLVFSLMGQFTQTEVQSAKGRADCVVWTKDAIYVFEFKLDGSAEEALAQIDDRSYAVPYEADGRKIVKIGVGFDKETCTIAGWKVGQGKR